MNIHDWMIYDYMCNGRCGACMMRAVCSGSALLGGGTCCGNCSRCGVKKWCRRHMGHETFDMIVEYGRDHMDENGVIDDEEMVWRVENLMEGLQWWEMSCDGRGSCDTEEV